MRTRFLLLAIILLSGCSRSALSTDDLKDGDLLFVVNRGGNNITSVTEGVGGAGIDHVAIYSDGNVIEAIPVRGVVEAPLDSFMVRLTDSETLLVGRVRGLDVPHSVENARKFIGLPYDDIFMPGDSAIYCSELVQRSYVTKPSAGKGVKAVFETIPMSFHDSTGCVTEFWTKFYAARGLAVPEGEPGTNPGQISRDPQVRILGLLVPSTGSGTSCRGSSDSPTNR